MMSYRMRSQKPNRRVRRKFEEAKGLSITSLVDVLTILLVFLVKNISMEAQRVTVPDNMNFPSIMQSHDLLERKGTTAIRVYPDRILIGEENLYFGTLQELETDPVKRTEILKYLQSTAQRTMELKDQDGNPLETALLIQADRTILCQHITTLVELGTSSFYQYIYFANLLDQDWLGKTKTAQGG